MNRKKNGPPPEAMRLKPAFERSGLSQAEVARQLNVSPGMVWQWLEGRSPVAADKAVKLAALVGQPPEAISAAYAKVIEQESSYSGSTAVPQIGVRDSGDIDERRQDLVIRRLENDVDSLRYAMAGLVSAMIAHRPAEAADVARVFRKTVPLKFRERGFLHELLTALERAEKA